MNWADNSELKKKQKRLDELAKIIKLHSNQPLVREQNTEIEQYKERLEFRLNSLVLESKLKELDIKCEVYEKIVEIINQYNK